MRIEFKKHEVQLINLAVGELFKFASDTVVLDGKARSVGNTVFIVCCPQDDFSRKSHVVDILRGHSYPLDPIKFTPVVKTNGVFVEE